VTGVSTVAASPTPGRRALTPWYALLLLAVVVGAVAALLIGSAPAPERAPAGQLEVDLPMTFWGLLCLSPLISGFGILIVRRILEPQLSLPGRAVISIVVLFALLLVFLYLLASGGSGSQGQVTITTGPTNGNTSTTVPVNNSSFARNATGVAGSYTVTIGTWEVLVAVVGISAAVAGLALPGVISRLVDRPARAARGSAAARARARGALASAGAAIARGEDPRETVVRLYVELLGAIEPRVGDTSILTADEIRRQTLAALGVSTAAAEVLTRLFEEARYSTHPMGSDEAGRFGSAIRQVEADLLRSMAS